MPKSTAENHLADRHYVSVVLRLVLDQHGQMIHGELVGEASRLLSRFSGWHGLTRAVQVWLSQYKQDDPADEPETL